MRRLWVEIERAVPDSTLTYQPPTYREATPEEIRAAFLAKAEASGAAQTVRELHRNARQNVRPDSGDIDFGVGMGIGTALEALGLPDLLEAVAKEVDE